MADASEPSTLALAALRALAADPALPHREQGRRAQELAGPALPFLLSLRGLPGDPLLEALELLGKYLDAFDGIVASLELPAVLDMVRQRGSDRATQLMLDMLKWDLRKNLMACTADHPAIADAIVEFSVAALLGADLDSAEKATEVLRVVIPSKPAHLAPLRAASEKIAHIDTAESRTVLLRVYTLVCDLCKVSEEQTSAADDAGFVADIVGLCQTDDILVQIVAMELLVALACTEPGLEALNRTGGIRWLIQTACGALGADPVTQDEALRVLSAIFAHAAQHSILFVERCDPGAVPLFLDTVTGYLEEGAERSKISGLACLSDFMSISAHSLKCVTEHAGGRLLQAWMRLLSSSKPELQGAALTSIAMVFFQPDEQYVQNKRSAASAVALAASAEEPSLEQVRQLKKELFRQVDLAKRGSAVQYLIHSAKQPVQATRYPAIQVLTALAGQQSGWGVQLLFQGAGSDQTMLQSEFFVFLANRLTESSKEGKDFKFALIHAVALHPAAQHFPPEVKRRLQLLVAQGAYYVPAAMEEMQTL